MSLLKYYSNQRLLKNRPLLGNGMHYWDLTVFSQMTKCLVNIIWMRKSNCAQQWMAPQGIEYPRQELKECGIMYGILCWTERLYPAEVSVMEKSATVWLERQTVRLQCFTLETKVARRTFHMGGMGKDQHPILLLIKINCVSRINKLFSWWANKPA